MQDADGSKYIPVRGCIACGGFGHSHCTCVLLGAALHRKLDPHKDMKDVVDVILRLLLLWDWREARVDKEITCLSYAPSCDVMVAGSRAGICFIKAQTGEKILCPVTGHNSLVSGVAFHPEKPTILVSCSWDETIKIWDVTSGSCLSTLKVDAGDFGVLCVTFNGTGDTIVAGCYNGNIFFIDTSTRKVREPPLKVDAGTFGVRCVTSNSTGDTTIAGCWNGNIFLINTATSQVREPPLSFGWDSSPVLSIAFKDNMIAAGCGNGHIKIFRLNESRDWGQIQSESPLRGHRYVHSLCRELFYLFLVHQITNLVCLSSDYVGCVAFKPDNSNILVSGSYDETIKMWDITSGSCLLTLTGHSGPVRGVTFSAEVRWLVSGSWDKTIRLWDTHAGATVVSPV